MPPQLEDLLHPKCGDRAKADTDTTYERKMVDLEKIAEVYDEEYHKHGVWGLEEATGLNKQFGADGERLDWLQRQR